MTDGMIMALLCAGLIALCGCQPEPSFQFTTPLSDIDTTTINGHRYIVGRGTYGSIGAIVHDASCPNDSTL
jgi:hypothetical protein